MFPHPLAKTEAEPCGLHSFLLSVTDIDFKRLTLGGRRRFAAKQVRLVDGTTPNMAPHGRKGRGCFGVCRFVFDMSRVFGRMCGVSRKEDEGLALLLTTLVVLCYWSVSSLVLVADGAAFCR